MLSVSYFFPIFILVVAVSETHKRPCKVYARENSNMPAKWKATVQPYNKIQKARGESGIIALAQSVTAYSGCLT